MGCCLGKPSSQQNPKPDPSLKNPSLRRRSPEPNAAADAGGARSPPPVEEETVKEVLSETPIPKPACFTDNAKKRNETHPTVEEEVKIESTAAIQRAEEVSVVSEMSETVSYTFSESLSTATEKREEDGEVNQRVHRSPAKVPTRKRSQLSGHVPRGNERGVRSPARQSAPSPVKRNHLSSTSRQVQGSPMTTAARRNVGPPANRLRRDAGECSGRRSRSPVTRGEVGQRRPVRYKNPTVAPNGRPSDRGPPVTAEDDVERRTAREEALGEATESLENPLVSLECFIFV